MFVTNKWCIPLVPLGGFYLHQDVASRLSSSRPPESSSTVPRADPPDARMSRSEFALEMPSTGGLSCSSSKNFVSAALKLPRVVLQRIGAGIMFHSLAPLILYD